MNFFSFKIYKFYCFEDSKILRFYTIINYKLYPYLTKFLWGVCAPFLKNLGSRTAYVSSSRWRGNITISSDCSYWKNWYNIVYVSYIFHWLSYIRYTSIRYTVCDIPFFRTVHRIHYSGILRPTIEHFTLQECSGCWMVLCLTHWRCQE